MLLRVYQVLARKESPFNIKFKIIIIFLLFKKINTISPSVHPSIHQSMAIASTAVPSIAVVKLLPHTGTVPVSPSLNRIFCVRECAAARPGKSRSTKKDEANNLKGSSEHPGRKRTASTLP
jgi:hypothetical protein